MNTGDNARIDLEIECTYLNDVKIKIWESDESEYPGPDGHPSDGSGDDFQGETYIRRGDKLDENNRGSRVVDASDINQGNGEYKIAFRVISDPIPTVRIHGIYCEKQATPMEGGVVNAISGAAQTVSDAAAKVLETSPRPSRKLLGEAFEAASKVIAGVTEIVNWLAKEIEGPDDVYLLHVGPNNSRSTGGGFYPEIDGNKEMEAGDMVCFEDSDECGHYFRFPLDEGEVRIEFREEDMDPFKDILIGSIIIDTDAIQEGGNAGISGGSPTYGGQDPIVGGVAEYDGAAVVEIANSYYGREGGAGAIYYICYSIGTEDWLLPATSYVESKPQDGKKFQIISKYSGKYWNLPKNTSYPDLIQSSSMQTFLLEQKDQYFRMKCIESGLYVGYQYGAGPSNTKLVGVNSSIDTMRYVEFIDQGDGYYLINGSDPRPIGLTSLSHDEGVRIDDANYGTTGAGYLFKMIPVD